MINFLSHLGVVGFADLFCLVFHVSVLLASDKRGEDEQQPDRAVSCWPSCIRHACMMLNSPTIALFMLNMSWIPGRWRTTWPRSWLTARSPIWFLWEYIHQQEGDDRLLTSKNLQNCGANVLCSPQRSLVSYRNSCANTEMGGWRVCSRGDDRLHPSRLSISRPMVLITNIGMRTLVFPVVQRGDRQPTYSPALPVILDNQEGASHRDVFIYHIWY